MEHVVSHLRDQTNLVREIMIDPEEVGVMLELHRKGWGAKRIAKELGVSKNTVKRYVRHAAWRPMRGQVRKRSWMGWRIGLPSGFASIEEMQKSCGRS